MEPEEVDGSSFRDIVCSHEVSVVFCHKVDIRENSCVFQGSCHFVNMRQQITIRNGFLIQSVGRQLLPCF